jgi:hypothetical protein
LGMERIPYCTLVQSRGKLQSESEIRAIARLSTKPPTGLVTCKERYTVIFAHFPFTDSGQHQETCHKLLSTCTSLYKLIQVEKV